MPAYPLDGVIDPTGAGDTFAGGLVGYLAANIGPPVDHDLLATATAYGTAVASFNVEEFGTERVTRLTFEEVQMRVSELHRMTQFSHPLREKHLV
jgi:sugar/nucleoside kinase (ribokinase family)